MYRSVSLEQGLARRADGGGLASGDGADHVDHGAVGGDVAFFLCFIFILLLNDDLDGVLNAAFKKLSCRLSWRILILIPLSTLMSLACSAL